MTKPPAPMSYFKTDNVFEGVRLYNTETEFCLSVANAETLRDEINESLAVAAGYNQLTVVAADVEHGQKLVLNGNKYTVKNVLSGINDTTTLQWQDYFGEQGEITVPEDFEVLIWERIE